MLSQGQLQALFALVQSLRKRSASEYLSLLQLPPYFQESLDFALASDCILEYRVYALVVATVLVCLLATLYAKLVRRRTCASRISRSREVLQSILYVVTPTRSVWPQHFISAAQGASALRGKTVQLPLRTLVEDMLNGCMEMRVPQQDLPGLLRNALSVNGWTFGLYAERTWRLDLMRWVLAAQLAPSKSKNVLVECATELHSSIGRDPRYKNHSLIPGGLSDALPLAISLDQVAYTLLEPAIRALQSSMDGDHSLTLVFTTLGEHVPWLSNNFALAALPFSPLLNRTHAPKNITNTLGRHSYHHAPAPFFSSLSKILELLASGPSPLAITAVFNLSEENAKAFNAYAESLWEDKILMQRFIQQRGIETWRAEQLRASWEGACLTTRLIEKWAIVVRSCS